MSLLNRLLCLLLVLFAGNTYGQGKINLNQGGPTAKNYSSAIPYQMVNGKILVDVELAGAKHKFIFDTGAPMWISTALASQLKVKILGKASTNDISGKNDSVSFSKIDGLKLGDVTFSGIPCVVNTPNFIDCLGAEGLIGSNMLRNSIVGLETTKHLLIITDQPEKLFLNKQQAAPMLVDSMQSSPQFTISLNGLTGTIPFDTGMSNFMNLKEEWVKVLQDKKTAFETIDKGFGFNVIGAFGLQAEEEKYLLKFPFVQIGLARFEHLYTETIKLGTPVIGTKLLDYGNIVLDYINKQYYFYPRTPTIDMEEKHWPLSIIPKDGKLFVSMTWNKGAGLVKTGEQVLSIDGKDYSHPEPCELITKELLPNDKTTITLVIKDIKGKTRTVDISKQ
ncbi:MAG: retropepsin-like aspartic protease [Bacteroidota bacterium]